MNDKRVELLTTWYKAVGEAATSGALDPKHGPIAFLDVQPVCGPRAGALELLCGYDTPRFRRLMSAGECDLHRQFIPWNFSGAPSVYMAGRYVRLEAGWPDDVAERDIPLHNLGKRPGGKGGRWIAGKNERGRTITLGFSDISPHFLFAGWTRSGKTTALRLALAQLCQDHTTRLVLVDGKFGDGFNALAHLPNVIGPVAIDVETARSALAWTYQEMKQRYLSGNKHGGRIVVAVDEVQEFAGAVAGDNLVIELVRRLAVQGAGADIHLLLGTQHPTMAAFSDPAIKRNMTGKIALRVEDSKASQVAIGASVPRADRLLGCGDLYAVTSSTCQRAQGAYYTDAELEALNTSSPLMEQWPEFNAESLGTGQEAGCNRFDASGPELAAAIVNARQGGGRPALVRMLDNAHLGRPGSERAQRLMEMGRDAWEWMLDNQYCLPACQGSTQGKNYEVLPSGKVISVPTRQAGGDDDETEGVNNDETE